MIDTYIAIFTHSDGDTDASFARAADAFRSMGLHKQYACGPMTLFGSGNLPTLSLPDGGLLIGDLFTFEADPVDTNGLLSAGGETAQIRRLILENYWGSYLLVQPEDQGASGFTITRAPAAAGNIPCFYSVKNAGGFLTSDISLAMQAGLYRKRVDWEAIAHRLRYPGVKTQRTGLADILELLPGCSVRIRSSEVSTRREWSPWDFVSPERRYQTPQEAAAQVRSAVVCSVRARSSSDRSILLELSGGLDSSIVAACLKDGESRVVCCNLAAPVPGVDERRYAGMMARELGVELHVEHIGFDQARLEFAPSADSVAPGMGPLQYAIDGTMEAAAERHDVATFYSGGGGDSVFSYLRTAAPAVDAFRAQGIGTALTTVADLSRLHQCTLWKAGHLALSKLRRPPSSPYRENATFLISETADIAPEEHPWFDAPADALPGDRERIFDLAGNQLFQGQAARASRRPFRFPLLAQPVMESCLRAPSWTWISGGCNRAVARMAFSDVLPKEILNRKSKATYMSYLGVVYQRNKVRILDFLLSGRLASEGLLQTPAIKDFITGTLPPRDQTFLRMFELCMVENWVRHQP